MFRFIGTAAIIALAVANPVCAQGKSHGNGNGSGNGSAKDTRGGHIAIGQSVSGNHKAGKSGKSNTAERVSPGDGGSGLGALEHMKVDRGPDLLKRVRDVRMEDRVQIAGRSVLPDRRGDGDRGGWDGDGDWDGRGRTFASVPGCPPGLAKKNNGCLPPGLAKNDRDRYFGYSYRPTLFGIPLRTRADYVFHDGYLVPTNGSSGMSYIALLGGALAVGQTWPQEYPTQQLESWQRDYYGFDDERDYRYADNVVYRVDPETSAIETVVALLTGNDFTIGQQMPDGYDVYNVPGDYRDQYQDTDRAMYRYADGRVYELDPTTLLIRKAIELVL